MTVPAEENVEHTLLSYPSSVHQADAKIVLGFTGQGGLVTPLLILATSLYKALGDHKIGQEKYLQVQEDKGKENYDNYLETNRQVRYMGVFKRSGLQFESDCSIYVDLERQLQIPQFLRKVETEWRKRTSWIEADRFRTPTQRKAAGIVASVVTASRCMFSELYLRPIDIQGCFHQARIYLRLGKPLEGFCSGAIPWKDTTQVIEVYNLRKGGKLSKEAEIEEGFRSWENVNVSLAGRIPGLTHEEARNVLLSKPNTNHIKGDAILIKGEFPFGKKPTEKVKSALRNGFNTVYYKDVPPLVEACAMKKKAKEISSKAPARRRLSKGYIHPRSTRSRRDPSRQKGRRL
jgi:hypothetical protein